MRDVPVTHRGLEQADRVARLAALMLDPRQLRGHLYVVRQAAVDRGQLPRGQLRLVELRIRLRKVPARVQVGSTEAQRPPPAVDGPLVLGYAPRAQSSALPQVRVAALQTGRDERHLGAAARVSALLIDHLEQQVRVHDRRLEADHAAALLRRLGHGVAREGHVRLAHEARRLRRHRAPGVRHVLAVGRTARAICLAASPPPSRARCGGQREFAVHIRRRRPNAAAHDPEAACGPTRIRAIARRPRRARPQHQRPNAIDDANHRRPTQAATTATGGNMSSSYCGISSSHVATCTNGPCRALRRSRISSSIVSTSTATWRCALC